MKYVTLFVGDYTAYSKSFILLYSPCITSHPYDNGIGQDTGFFVDNSVKIQPCSSEKKFEITNLRGNNTSIPSRILVISL